jgi:hypothetical protein
VIDVAAVAATWELLDGLVVDRIADPAAAASAAALVAAADAAACALIIQCRLLPNRCRWCRCA